MTVAGLPYGKIAYQIPQKSKIDNAAIATLRLSPKKTFEELERVFKTEEGVKYLSGTNDVSQLKFARIKISPRMRATLDADSKSITISTETEPIQAVSFHDDTVWSWHIVAEKPGKYWLHIQLAMLVEIDNHETYRTIESYSDYIAFEATPIERVAFYLEEHWEGASLIISSILIPLFVYFWNKRNRPTTI